jgi:hypothetical protein
MRLSLKPKLIWIFKNSVRTAKKTQLFTITKISWLTLFEEIIAVCTENNTKPINTKCRVTDCWSSWYVQLPLGFKGLKLTQMLLLTVNPSNQWNKHFKTQLKKYFSASRHESVCKSGGEQTSDEHRSHSLRETQTGSLETHSYWNAGRIRYKCYIYIIKKHILFPLLL